MNKLYLTSDLHLGHDRDFMWEPRGFSSVEEHDAAIIKNWNETVDDLDTVIILGDLMLNNNEQGIKKLKQLNGFKQIVLGNHDTNTRVKLYQDEKLLVLGYAMPLKYKKYNFYLSHYPTLVGNYDDNGLHGSVINLCGHTHTKDRFQDMDKGLIYHCELDAHDNKPIWIDDIIKDIREYIYD